MIGRGLTGPLGLFVQFSTLKEYGVDKVFELENGNTDSSQRNIVYLVHGEKANLVQAVAGKTWKSSTDRTRDLKEIASMTFILLFAISLVPIANSLVALCDTFHTHFVHHENISRCGC